MNVLEVSPRLALALLLALWGGLLRFGSHRVNTIPLPWTEADPEIAAQANRRVGLYLLIWAGWLFLSLLLRFQGSIWGLLIAPLVLVVLLGASHSARLYVRKYETYRVQRIRQGEDQPVPKHGGWAVVILREILPMATLLVPILLISNQAGDLPDRIPVRLSPWEGPTDWRLKFEALSQLRQQTRWAYLVLLMGEAVYVIWKWGGNARASLAGRLLTPKHWKYFFFRSGWVAVLAGVNVGCVAFARADQAVWPYLIPGLGLLALVGGLVWWDHRRTTYVPPRKSEPY